VEPVEDIEGLGTGLNPFCETGKWVTGFQ
jgi:uncharacterized membrane protein YedE/YeeE